MQVLDESTGTLRWSATAGGTSPSIAGGLIFTGINQPHGMTQDVIYAFPANGCGASQCSPIWTGGSKTSPAFGDPTAITGGRVYGLSSGFIQVLSDSAY